MSRMKINNDEQINLAELIDKYKTLKDEESRIKKEYTPIGDDIKSTMNKQGLQKFSSEKFTATVSVTQKEDFNEDYAIEILKRNLTDEQLKQVIKTKEYIDDDAFEKLVYNNQIQASILEPAITKKEPTVTLRISKKKG